VGALRRASATIACAACCACTTPVTFDLECDPEWTTIFDDLDRVPLAAGGTASDDLWIVGGGLGVSGLGALVLHYDGERWRELDVAREETIWWVWAASKDDVWMTGERGLVLHYDGALFTRYRAPTEATLFGAFGAAPNEVWFTGGLPTSADSAHNDVLLRFDGQSIERDRSLPQRGRPLFKVWGSGGGELWLSGARGALYHYANGAWLDRSSEVQTIASPFTLNGCSRDEIYAVGGQDLFRFDGDAWSAMNEVAINTSAIGVSCGEEAVLVTGLGGLCLWKDKTRGEWINDESETIFGTDFHAGFVAADGAMIAVGGDYLTPASDVSRRHGVVRYRGCAAPRTAIDERTFAAVIER
jgi:hypothetical protein